MKLNGFVKPVAWRRDSALTALTSASHKRRIQTKNTAAAMVFVPPGAVLGVPLSIIQNVFTNLHYGYDITSWQSVGLQFLFGYYTYGKDRYKDALEYKEAPYATDKADMYISLLDNSEFYEASFFIVFDVIMLIMLLEFRDLNIVPFVLMLYSCEYYKDLKRVIPLAKPVYVSTMWTLSSVVLPCVLHDHDFTIFQDVSTYVPCFLTMFALTNVADIRDVDVDRLNEIKTIPVAFGLVPTATVAQVALLVSSLVFGLNPHYLDRPMVNALVELHNAALSGYLTYSTLNHERGEQP